MQENKKEKKITFSEKIDDNINTFSVALTFLIIGIFLTYNKNYFQNEIVSTVIKIIFIFFGIIGFITFVGKFNKNHQIKGMDNLIAGIVIFLIWFFIYFYVKSTIANTIMFFFLIFGLYGTCRGVLEILYSLKNESKNILGAIKKMIPIISELFGIMLIAIQILQALKIIWK